MSDNRAEEVSVLRLTLHDKLVGYLAGFQGGRNVLSFAEGFRTDTNRPTFSLITHPEFPRAEKLIAVTMLTTFLVLFYTSSLFP